MRIVIADDAVLLRRGLVSILEERHEVVAAVGTAPELMEAARSHQPDLVIADVRMPPTHTDDGISAVRDIRSRLPGTKAILLSQYVQAAAAIDLFQGEPTGLGYLLKDRVVQIDDFLDAVDRVGAGGTVLDPEAVKQLIGQSLTGPLDMLTGRELDVLSLMAEGLSNAGIGARLHLGRRTVEGHIGSLFGKLGIDEEGTEHRRVRAVLAYLSARG